MERKLTDDLPHDSDVHAPAGKVDGVDTHWPVQSPQWSNPVENLTTAHDIAILYLEGEIGLPEFHYLDQILSALRTKGFSKFVFSFAQVEHLNYRVFHELMKVAKHVRTLSGDLRFCQISPYLYHIFLFSGADQTIDHFTNLEEAILSFHNTHGRHWH